MKIRNDVTVVLTHEELIEAITDYLYANTSLAIPGTIEVSINGVKLHPDPDNSYVVTFETEEE